MLGKLLPAQLGLTPVDVVALIILEEPFPRPELHIVTAAGGVLGDRPAPDQPGRPELVEMPAELILHNVGAITQRLETTQPFPAGRRIVLGEFKLVPFHPRLVQDRQIVEHPFVEHEPDRLQHPEPLQVEKRYVLLVDGVFEQIGDRIPLDYQTSTAIGDIYVNRAVDCP